MSFMHDGADGNARACCGTGLNDGGFHYSEALLTVEPPPFWRCDHQLQPWLSTSPWMMPKPLPRLLPAADSLAYTVDTATDTDSCSAGLQ